MATRSRSTAEASLEEGFNDTDPPLDNGIRLRHLPATLIRRLLRAKRAIFGTS